MHTLNQSVSLGVLIIVKTGFISKSFIKGVKYHLNSDPLSNMTLHGRGYLLRRVLLNNWLTLADDLSTYSPLLPITSLKLYVGISKISNQPVVGSIIDIQVRLTLYIVISLPDFCCLIYLISGPMGSTCT